ncbi:MAG: hypothetical protein AB8G95_19255 [Anaerolineae bacterium]
MTEENDVWEYCQVDYKVWSRASLDRVDFNQQKLFWLQFQAEATDSTGRYIAARSEKFPHLGDAWAPAKENMDHHAALAGFVDLLKADDWELLTDKGSEWWNKKLRRPLDSPKRERSVFQGIKEFFS